MFSKKLKTLFLISAITIFTIILHYIGWLAPIENFFRNILNPGSQAFYSLSVQINDEAEEFTDIDKLKQAYIKIRSELAETKVDNVNYKLLEVENYSLRELLNFYEKNQIYKHVGADVIGKNVDPISNTIILNRGTRDGVAIGNPVITNNGILIGKISKAEESSSIVRLINDNQSRIAATIMNGEKSLGIIEGGYDISVRMNFIPQNETISIGDTVITSGLESEIPYGLIIGTLESIEKEAYQPFQKAIVSPLVDLESLQVVSIIVTTTS